MAADKKDEGPPSFRLPDQPIVPVAPSQQQGLSIEQALNLAAQHQSAGNLPQAEAFLKQILQHAPNQPQALGLLGVIAHQVGKNDLAAQLIEKAIEADAKVALFHANLGEIYRLLGKLDLAIERGERAIALEPENVMALSNLGIAYFDSGQFDKAEAVQEKALRIDPNFSPSLNNMGSIRREQKRYEEAADLYQRAIANNPSNLEPMNNLGVTLTQLDRPREALEVLDKALTLQPAYTEAVCNKGFALNAMEQDEEALGHFQEALRLRPDYAEAHLGIAQVRHKHHELEEAEDRVRTALSLKPQLPEGVSLLGSILLSNGRGEEAYQSFQEALKLEPGLKSARLGLGSHFLEQGDLQEAETLFAEIVAEAQGDTSSALFNLVQARKNKAGETHVEALFETAKNAKDLPPAKAISLQFAMGKVLDDLGDHDKAFEHFNEGCRLKRETIQYDADAQDRLFEEVKQIFSAEYIEDHRGAGCSSTVPIFVLGMPRSGTTLTEQILASHPNVYGAGELFDFIDLAQGDGATRSTKARASAFPNNMKAITNGELTALGERYIEGLKARAPGVAHVTDKMPANYFHVGLIHLALPEAKIIHVHRHPPDTCISCFTRLFAFNQYNTYDLEELGRYYKGYEALMDHWREVLGEEAFLDIRYEDLVDNTEEEAKRLLAYCGLDWDPQVLEFHQTERTVRTASFAQVRQPIYRSSLERWKRYDRHLIPLKKALGMRESRS